MKILPVIDELLYADGRTDGPDMTKLKDAFAIYQTLIISITSYETYARGQCQT